MSLQAAVAEPAARERAAKLSLGPTAALLFAARSLQYVVFGVTGIVLARGLGPDGRGVFPRRDRRRDQEGDQHAAHRQVCRPNARLRHMSCSLRRIVIGFINR